MLEIQAFEKLLEVVKQHKDFQFLTNDEKHVDESYLHNNDGLIQFYRKFDLQQVTIETGVSLISFIDYSNLKERNAEYHFSNLNENECIVFLEQSGGGEPILFNFADNTAIYAAYDVLDPFKIADNFIQFIEALTALADIVYNEYNIYEVYTNDDCDEIKPEFLPKMNSKLAPILGDNTANFMNYFYG